uniref:Ca2: Cation Antiporter (CaCA) Family putative n=1 Tax=Albugo laibachii Nc14 TaxID=890382 RepID=F0WPW3_9STRA|nr:Ca2 :Cation Antiporter (CaCA) Family putative [Albugo laibachii Nc14]|eukprot:CCA23364.1 Ca2 :Cation Antiporter (CaCA) Family putative [Albugo laibachii Nc14]
MSFSPFTLKLLGYANVIFDVMNVCHEFSPKATKDMRVHFGESKRMHTRQANASIRKARQTQSSNSADESGIPEILNLHGFGKNSHERISLLHSSFETGSDTQGSWKGDLTAIRNLLLGSRLNVLLLVAPFAIWSYVAHWNDTWIFTLNFIVMIPLANVLGEATEALAIHTGETIGGLVNATFGNAVEVVVAVLALTKGEIAVVQSSLIGSVLSNLLLVLGCSFIAGGMSSTENVFNAVGASANSSLLMLASFAMLLPSYIYYFSNHETHEEKMKRTLALSRVAALFLLFMYAQLLIFQLHTHSHIFQGEEGSQEQVELSRRASAIVLFGATIIVSVFSEFLVSSIDGFTTNMNLSKSFVGIILLPIIGNAVEHVTAIRVARNGKMELAMGVAVGSATQVSLFVVPIVVIAGWIMGQPMTLAFPEFEILIYMMSVIIAYAIIADGKSNWLEGSMLITASRIQMKKLLLCISLPQAFSYSHATADADTCSIDETEQCTGNRNTKFTLVIGDILAQSSASSSNFERTKSLSLETLGYVTPWNGQGYEMAERFRKKLTYIVPVWYQIRDGDSDGFALTGSHDVDQEWMKRLQPDVKIVPRVIYERRSWDEDGIPALVDAIVDEVEAQAFDGVTLEIPLIPLVTNFIISLGGALQNAEKIFILVVGQSQQDGTPSISSDMLDRLASVVHRFSMNAYDYQAPGPNAPLHWISNTLNRISPRHRAKLLIGIPFYGYDNNDAITGSSYLSALQSVHETYPEASLQWDSTAHECFFEYRKHHQLHRVYYPCLEFLHDRFALIQERFCAGVAIWELGQETLLIHDKIRDSKTKAEPME